MSSAETRMSSVETRMSCVGKDKCLSGKHVYRSEFIKGRHDFTLVFSVEMRLHFHAVCGTKAVAKIS
jgi:hypothetical protein